MTVVILLIVACVAAAITWLCFNPAFDIYSLHHFPTSKKLIALTFDDGPCPDSTAAILRILKEHSVKATFFVVGQNVRKYPQLLQKTFNDGHLIGNHSDTHGYTMIYSPKATLEDIKRTESSIEEVITQRPVLYRPPFGFRTPWGAKGLHESGYHIVTWDDMTYDYWGLPAAKVVRNIIKKSHPGGIIVLHDGHEGLARSGLTNVVDALPEIIGSLQEQEYEFVTLDRLLGIEGYRP